MPDCVAATLPELVAADLIEAVNALEQARETLRTAGNRAGEADALYCLGLTTYVQGVYPSYQQPFLDARRHFERALVAYREVGNRSGEARSQQQFGRTYLAVEDLSNTLPQYQQALRTAQAVNDVAIQGDVFFDLGQFYLQRRSAGDIDLAVTNFREAYAAYFSTQNVARQAETLTALAETEFALWQLNKAAEDFLAAAQTFRTLGDLSREAGAVHGAARIRHHVGDLYAAEEYYNQALELYQQDNNVLGQGRVTSALGNIYFQQSYGIAEATLNEALTLNQAAGDTIGRSITMSYLGELALARGDTSRAISSFGSALELSEIEGDIAAGALAYLGRGRVYAELARQKREPLRTALNDFGEAARRYRDLLGDTYSLRRVFLNEAWAWYGVEPSNVATYEPLFFEAVNKPQTIGDKRGETESLMALGQLYRSRILYDDAARYFEQASQRAVEVADPILIGDTNAALGEIELLRARLNEARDRFETARFNFDTGGDIVKSATANSHLGEIAQRLGSYYEAIDYYRSTATALTGYNDPRSNQPLVRRTLATTQLALGTLYIDLGLYERAESQLRDALPQLTAIGDNFSIASAHVSLGDTLFARRDYSGAENAYRQGDRFGEQSGNLRAKALAHSGLGSVLVATGTGTELRIQEAFEGALAQMRTINDFDGVRRVLMSMGEAAVEQRHLDDAITYFSDAGRTALSIGDRRSDAFAALRLAHTYSLDPADRLNVTANQAYEEAVRKFRRIEDSKGESMALQGLGEIALRRSQFNAAIEYFTQMRVASTNANDPIGKSNALNQLAQTYQGQKRYDRALIAFNEASDTLLFELDRQDELTDQRLAMIAEGEMLRARGDFYRVISQIELAEADLTEAESILNNTSLLAESQLSLAVVALGDLRLQQRQYVEASTLFERARSLAERSDDNYAYGLALYGIARVYTFDGDPSNIGEEERTYSRVLNHFRTVVPNPAVARQILMSLAESYDQRGLYRDAETWYRTAQNEAREAGDPTGEGYALLALGDLRLERFRFDEALVDYNEAVRQFQRGGDWIGRGEALYHLAEIYQIRVDYIRALEQYQSALALYETEGDILRQAETLTRIGEAYQRQARLALALNQHFLAQDALNLAKEELLQQNALEVSAGIEARILRNLGLVRRDMGQFEVAKDVLKEALNLATTSGDVFEVASTLQLLGQIEQSEGRFEVAFDLYERAADEFGGLNALQQLGEIYVDMGDVKLLMALDTVQVGGIGSIQEALHALDELEGLNNSQEVLQTLFDRSSEARIQYQRALDVARNLGDVVMEIRAQQGLGKVFNWLQQNDEARDRLLTAERLVEEVELLPLRASILVDLGLLAEERNDRNSAIDYYIGAVELFEDVYADIRIEPGQIAFASQNILPYHRLVSLYADSDPEKALEFAERGRARSLLYQLGVENVDFGVTGTAELLAEWQARRLLIRELRSQIDANILARTTEPSLTERDRLEREIDSLRTEILAVQDSLADLRERLDTQNAVLAQVTQIDPRSLIQIQEGLNDDTSVLSYYVIPELPDDEGKVYAFVITQDNFSVEQLNVTPRALKTTVTEGLAAFRELAEVSDTFVNLYDELIAPVKPMLEGEQVVVVPHGILNTVPFGALTEDKINFFGDEKALVYASSATLYSLLQEDRQPRMDEIVGSAIVYGNPTSPEFIRPASATRSSIGPLYGAESEAETIADMLRVEPQLGRLATESNLWVESQQVRVIHIAAHGVFNPQNPLASFLALADDEDNDGALQVREVYSLSLHDNQPLVVLSACDTAVGGLSQSDDLQSLSRAFLISGARSVVASLWKVDDSATQALMTRFYDNLIDRDMTVTGALQDAQAYIRGQSGWESPQYWAAFVIVGLP